MRQNLLITYASTHAVRQSLEPNRSWDWIEVTWDMLGEARHTQPDERLRGSPGRRKFRNAFLLISPVGYEAVCVADDDVVPANCSWSGVFALFHETKAHVGQPALTLDSHHSHAITLQEAGVRWRETSFVECMAPILSAEGVARYWGFLDAAGLGWGLEALWSQREREAGRNLVILDATPIRHGRPVGGGHRGLEVDPTAEADAFVERHGLTRVPAETLVRHR